jgi:hypothetical protein
MQATVTLKGTTEEVRILSACAYVMEAVLLGWDGVQVNNAGQIAVQGLIGYDPTRDERKALLQKVRGAVAELPRVGLMDRAVQMPMEFATEASEGVVLAEHGDAPDWAGGDA